MPLIRIEDLKDDHFQMIEEMASTGFPPGDVAEVLEIDAEIFNEAFNNKNSDVYKRYRKGYLSSELKLRQRIFKDAANGSSPAQTLAKKILDDLSYKLANNG